MAKYSKQNTHPLNPVEHQLNPYWNYDSLKMVASYQDMMWLPFEKGPVEKYKIIFLYRWWEIRLVILNMQRIQYYPQHNVISYLPEDIYLLNLGADKVDIPVRRYIPVYFASFHYKMGLLTVLMLSEVAFLVFDILLVYFETRPSTERWHLFHLENV